MWIIKNSFKLWKFFYRLSTISSASLLLILSDFSITNILAALTQLLISIPDYTSEVFSHIKHFFSRQIGSNPVEISSKPAESRKIIKDIMWKSRFDSQNIDELRKATKDLHEFYPNGIPERKWDDRLGPWRPFEDKPVIEQSNNYIYYVIGVVVITTTLVVGITCYFYGDSLMSTMDQYLNSLTGRDAPRPGTGPNGPAPLNTPDVAVDLPVDGPNSPDITTNITSSAETTPRAFNKNLDNLPSSSTSPTTPTSGSSLPSLLSASTTPTTPERLISSNWLGVLDILTD